MKQVSTVCPRDCYDTCGLLVSLDDSGRVVSVRGDPDHPLTRGLTCPRAAADHLRLYTNRVLSPQVRTGGKTGIPGSESSAAAPLGAASWPAALDLVAQRLQQSLASHGPESVLYLSYSGNSGLLSLHLPQRLWNALGATQTDLALCSRSGSIGLGLHYGARYGLDPCQLPESKLIVFWGFNAAVSAMHIWARAVEARRSRGARVVVIDPRRSETAERADLWLRPAPGTDVALAYGLIHQLFELGADDSEFLQRWCTGSEALRSRASEWAPEQVERFSGVGAGQLLELAEAYAARRPSATLIGIGLQKNDHGADQVRAISLIPAVLGQHRGFYYSNGDAFYVNEEALSGPSPNPARVRVVSQVALPELLDQGKFKFVYVCGMNPAATLTNTNAFVRGLKRADTFVVVHETHWTDTARLADVVLPAPSFLEKRDLVLPWSHNFVQLSPQVVPPVTDSRTEIEVMCQLAQKMGLSTAYLCQDPWQAVQRAMTGALDPGSWDSLMAGNRLTLRRRPLDSYPTASGKIELESGSAKPLGLAPLPEQCIPSPREEGQFILLTSATLQYTHTQFQEIRGPIPADLLMNPDDAARMRLEEGQRVSIWNALGQTSASVHLSDAVLPGVLWSPRQWGGQNSLMSSQPQQTGGPRFNSTRVNIAPAASVLS